MVRSGWNVFFNSPRGPLTVTVLPSAVTVTSLGTATGSFPILDIVVLLPHHGEELTAGARLPRRAIGHQPLRRGQNRHPESVADARNLLDGDVLPESGRRHALELADHGFTTGIAQPHAQEALAAVRLDGLIILNEVVLLQDPGDFGFHTRHRH